MIHYFHNFLLPHAHKILIYKSYVWRAKFPLFYQKMGESSWRQKLREKIKLVQLNLTLLTLKL